MTRKKRIGSKSKCNEKLALELERPVIQKFERRKVYQKIKYNIWGEDLAVMGSLPSKNWGVKYLYVVHVFTKFAKS